jgi:hypothetical protein
MKIAHHDIPVDLLRRFSQPAGSSSSAIVARVFSIFCYYSSRQTPLVSIALNICAVYAPAVSPT